MGGLSGQQARPGHSQTILKSLLSPLGGWEAHKPGSEFILSTWSLGLGGPGGLVREPVSQLQSQVWHNCPGLSFTKFATMLNLNLTKAFLLEVSIGSCVCLRIRSRPQGGQEVWPCACCLQGWHLGNVPSKASIGAVPAASLPAHCGDKNEGSLRGVLEKELANAQVNGNPQSKTGRLQGAAVGGAVRTD